MRPFSLWLAAVTMALLPSMSSAVSVSVNSSARHQTIQGWGATESNCVIPANLREKILNEAVSDLGLTRLRLEPPRRDWEDPWNDNGDSSATNWAAFKTTNLDADCNEWIVPFKQKVIARGDPFNVYVSPSFFDGGSSGSIPTWMLQNPGEYAEWACSCLTYLRDTYGITADYYCICNEPNNGTAFSPTSVSTMIKTLGPRMKALGLPTKIEFPECSNSDNTWSYIQSTQNDAEMWQYVGVVTYHDYGSNNSRQNIRDFAGSKGLSTGETEYMGTTVNDIYNDLTLGGVSYWEHYVLAYYGNSTAGTGCYFGADHNNTSFTRYSDYWNFRQIMHYVRPGAVRVDVSSSDPALRALAFNSGGSITVVLLNNSDSTTRSATITGLPANSSYGLCWSIAAASYTEQGVTATDSSGSVTVSLPGNTVATLYPYSGANQAPTPVQWEASPNFLTQPASSTTLHAAAVDTELDPISYSWSVQSQPAGASAMFANSNSATTAVSGLSAAGDYIFRVTMSDASHTLYRDVELNVFADNQSPFVPEFGNRLPTAVVLPTTSTRLEASAWDLEGDPVTYNWTIVSQPAGASAALATPTHSICYANNLTISGDYAFMVSASDPTHTVSKNLTIHVYPVDNPPVISQISATPASVGLPTQQTQLSAVATDPDGDVLSPWWTVKSAPPGATPTFANQGEWTTMVSGLSVPGIYTFTVTVVARTQYTTRDVSVVVANGVVPDWINESFDTYTNGSMDGQGNWLTVGAASAQAESTFAKGGTGKGLLCDGVAAASTANMISFGEKTTGTFLVDFDVAQDATGAVGQELAYVSVYGSDSPTEIMRVHIQKGRIFAEYGPADPGNMAVMSTAIANLTWNNVRIGFNVDAKTFDLWLDGASKGTGYTWKTGATRVSRVVIGCDQNAALNPQKAYFDNLRVEPKPGQVASVNDDGNWSPSLSKLHFTFPAVAGTPEYQYAIGTSSGGTQIRNWTSCGTSTDVTAAGLSLTENTTTYYISVECLSQYGSSGAGRTSNGIKVGVGLAKISDGKALADGTSTQVKALRGKVVSAPFSGYFYVQEPDGLSGLKVVSTATVCLGDLVDVCGVMKGSGAERYLDGTGDGVIRTDGPGGPYPVILGDSAIGGVTLNSYTPGVIGGIGPNNIGLYAIAYGKVTQRQATDPKYFYIDDGTGLKDSTTTGGAANVGVRICADPASYPTGSYVFARGILSCFSSSGLRPQLLPVSVQLLRAP